MKELSIPVSMDCGTEEEDAEDLILHPITIDDITQHESTENMKFIPIRDMQENSAAMGISSGKDRRRRLSQVKRNRNHWWEAVKKIQAMADPWEKFHLDDYESKPAIRHRYNALRKTWVVDEIQVKMEPEPFNHGAMRECYRMRKITKHCHSNKWKTAANYVAKKYMDEVDKDIYFEDVKLQMDAKLWGEEFDRHNPPKKVDIFQVSVLEFVSPQGSSFFHIEHFIEGRYIKYNSNSGYVNDESRFTPHAFSHFTFERSGHELIVVDIQGVGDLYTDPQIHTASGKEYGDGNLGTRGMALFFHSHICNPICESLGLSSFDLSDTESNSLAQNYKKFCESATSIRGTEEICVSPSYYERTHWHEFLRSRSISGGNMSTDDMPTSPVSVSTSESDAVSDSDSGIGSLRCRRVRHDTDSGSITEEADRQMFSYLVAKISRPSSVCHEIEFRKLQKSENRKRTGGSILGQIHLEMAKYHELHRFTSPESCYDKIAALFHLKHAADCDTLEAIINLARLNLNLPHDILVDVEVEPSPENITDGLDYIQNAAAAGDKASMIYLAQAYDTGFNLGLRRKRSWKESVYWYNEAVMNEENDESGNYDNCMDYPKYMLLARMAEMHAEGNYGLVRNLQKSSELYQQAAEEATTAMKGRLASKYYILAEEVLDRIEE